MKALCPSLIDAFPPPFSVVRSHWCILQSMASQIRWNMVVSAWEGYGSGSQLDNEVHEVILLSLHIYHFERIYRRLTISIDLINLLGFVLRT